MHSLDLHPHWNHFRYDDDVVLRLVRLWFLKRRVVLLVVALLLVPADQDDSCASAWVEGSCARIGWHDRGRYRGTYQLGGRSLQCRVPCRLQQCWYLPFGKSRTHNKVLGHGFTRSRVGSFLWLMDRFLIWGKLEWCRRMFGLRFFARRGILRRSGKIGWFAKIV
jgi:hypothetical protein